MASKVDLISRAATAGEALAAARAGGAVVRARVAAARARGAVARVRAAA